MSPMSPVADLPGDSGETGTSRDIGAGVAGTSAHLRHDIAADVADTTGPPHCFLLLALFTRLFMKLGRELGTTSPPSARHRRDIGDIHEIGDFGADVAREAQDWPPVV
jgi:hypothetical protein